MSLAPDASGLDVLDGALRGCGIETRYYTPEIHRASFVLPRYIKDAVNAATRPRRALRPKQSRHRDARSPESAKGLFDKGAR